MSRAAVAHRPASEAAVNLAAVTNPHSDGVVIARQPLGNVRTRILGQRQDLRVDAPQHPIVALLARDASVFITGAQIVADGGSR